MRKHNKSGKEFNYSSKTIFLQTFKYTTNTHNSSFSSLFRLDIWEPKYKILARTDKNTVSTREFTNLRLKKVTL